MTAPGAPPVFLDRDGTLIVEKDYLSDPGQVCLEDGVVDGLTLLNGRGHPLIVLSNQSGIGRGMFTEREAHLVNARVAEILSSQGIEVMAWYMCPHGPEAGCECRKPSPGMALEAAREYHVDLVGSFVIGDKQSDLELADAIGGTGILVTTGHGPTSVERALAQRRPVFAGLRAAAEYILSRQRGTS